MYRIIWVLAVIKLAELDSGSFTLLDLVVELSINILTSFFELGFGFLEDNSSLVSFIKFFYHDLVFG